MSAIESRARPYELTSDGRLADLGRWTEEAAEFLARREGISLTPNHWEVISVMRLFYREFNLSPSRKLLKRAIAERLGPEKARSAYLDRLFPGGLQRQGSRIAGIPEPSLDVAMEHRIGAPASPADRLAARAAGQTFEFEGRHYDVHPNGNLVRPEEWSESMAVFLAEREGIKLSEEHWEVLRFLRGFYFQYGISPMVRLLIKHMQAEGDNDQVTEDDLYRLFPGGPSRQGSRIAGLPEPQGCIDP